MLQHCSDNDTLQHGNQFLYFDNKNSRLTLQRARGHITTDDSHAELVSASKYRLATLHFTLHVRHHISGIQGISLPSPLRKEILHAMSTILPFLDSHRNLEIGSPVSSTSVLRRERNGDKKSALSSEDEKHPRLFLLREDTGQAC